MYEPLFPIGIREHPFFDCTNTLKIQSFIKPVVYDYFIHGFFSKFDGQYSNSQMFVLYGIPYKHDPAYDLSLVEWVNGKRSEVESLKSLPCHSRKYWCTWRTQPKLKVDTAFVANFKDIMPTHHQSMIFTFTQSRWESWIDFYIKKTNYSIVPIDRILIKTKLNYIQRIFSKCVLIMIMDIDQLEDISVKLQVTIGTEV